MLVKKPTKKSKVESSPTPSLIQLMKQEPKETFHLYRGKAAEAGLKLLRCPKCGGIDFTGYPSISSINCKSCNQPLFQGN